MYMRDKYYLKSSLRGRNTMLTTFLEKYKLKIFKHIFNAITNLQQYLPKYIQVTFAIDFEISPL